MTTAVELVLKEVNQVINNLKKKNEDSTTKTDYRK